MDSESRSVVVSLWEDMATNDGNDLQLLANEYPIISIGHVTAKKYLGELQLQTTMASIIQINSGHEEVEHLRSWLHQNNDPLKIHELAMRRRIKEAKETTLHDLIHNRASLCEDNYYFFEATVDKVENKSYIWYDSCIICNSSISKNGDIVACRKCNNDHVETTPRYRLLLNVVQGNVRAFITLFEEATMLYVGCPVKEYLISTEQDETKSKYYKGLSLQTTTKFRFLIPLNKKATIINAQLNVVAEAIEKLNPIKEMDIKNETKVAKIKKVRKKISKSIENNDENLMTTLDKKTTTMKLRKKKTIPNDEEISISSEDDETIDKLFKKARKTSKEAKEGSSTRAVKPKKEKTCC
ncbi:hypothetical protein ACP275_07G083700 [Erythranthe tilingii]